MFSEAPLMFSAAPGLICITPVAAGRLPPAQSNTPCRGEQAGTLQGAVDHGKHTVGAHGARAVQCKLEFPIRERLLPLSPPSVTLVRRIDRRV